MYTLGFYTKHVYGNCMCFIVRLKVQLYKAVDSSNPGKFISFYSLWQVRVVIFNNHVKMAISDSCYCCVNFTLWRYIIFFFISTFTVICLFKFRKWWWLCWNRPEITLAVGGRMCELSERLIIIILVFSGPRHHRGSVPAKQPSPWNPHAGLHDPIWHQAIDGSGVHSDCTSTAGKKPQCR